MIQPCLLEHVLPNIYCIRRCKRVDSALWSNIGILLVSNYRINTYFNGLGYFELKRSDCISIQAYEYISVSNIVNLHDVLRNDKSGSHDLMSMVTSKSSSVVIVDR